MACNNIKILPQIDESSCIRRFFLVLQETHYLLLISFGVQMVQIGVKQANWLLLLI